MKELRVYQTSDGKIHSTRDEAKKHADKRYGDALLVLAKELAYIGSSNAAYQKISEFLEDDGNIQRFVDLQKLKADIHKDVEPDQWDE